METKHPFVIERFLHYVTFDTKSVDGVETKPSSHGQVNLANAITEDLCSIVGFMPQWIQKFSDGSFAVVMPANQEFEKIPHVAFAAHMDTYFNFPGKANPIVHPQYESGDILLPHNEVVIPAEDLVPYLGKQIITGDGTSVLGGDDKAGAAALVSTIDNIVSAEIKHGPLTFWFCVDEEIGNLDVKALPKDLVESWDILWTVDGEKVGTIDVGSFVCRKLEIVFKGQDAHPGVDGKNLHPAHYAAACLIAELFENQPDPMSTEDDEPFYYVTGINGDASEAKLLCMPRTFDADDSEHMAEEVRAYAETAANQFGVSVNVTDKLVTVNTMAAITNNRRLLEPGIEAHKRRGFVVSEKHVRGGTDGGMINIAYPKLPAPNIGASAKNFHGPKEFVVLEDLVEVPLIMTDMVIRYSQMQ